MFDAPHRVEFLLEGVAEAPLLVLDAPVSLWGGVDSLTGVVTEVGHPQQGCSLAGVLLVTERTKGSTAGPGALLELIARGCAPLAVLLSEPDPVPLAASMAAQFAGHAPLPVAIISDTTREALRDQYLEDPRRSFVLDPTHADRIRPRTW
ncbi:MAG: DUF126 domain-containing protein [Pseudomonadota bacterium]